MADDREDLVDRIYEAAVVPEKWPKVLADLCKLGDGAYSNLFVLKDGGLRSVGTPEADALVSEFVALGQPELNTRITRTLSVPSRPGFWTDFDIFTEDEIMREPFYRDFLHPRGYGWVAATAVPLSSGETLSVSVERFHRRGPYERKFIEKLDLLSPHLSRAGMLAARIGLDRARVMAEALSTVGLPAAVLRFNGRAFAMNPLFDALVPKVISDRPTRLTLTNGRADRVFAQALQGLRYAHREEAVRSIPLAASEERPPMIVHVVPVCGVARDIFALAAAIVVVTPIVPADVPQADVLQGLFDLTPAEARVARAIGGGQSINELSAALATSRETIRSHVKKVFSKVGVSRQADLISLLAGNTIKTDAP